MPDFSIIVPTYNRDHLIGATIKSILNQCHKSWELIIVDDGSSDYTEEVVAGINDDRIQYIKQKNSGPWAARNTGLAKAKGDIVVYVDSDDTISYELLRIIFERLQFDPSITYGICNHTRSIEFFDENGICIKSVDDTTPSEKKVTLQNFYDWNVKTTSSGIFHSRDKFLGKVEWRNTVRIEDLEFLLQLAVLDEAGFLFIPEHLVKYTVRCGSDGGMVSTANYLDYSKAFGVIYELHKNDPLMKNPNVYLDRIESYKKLQEKFEAGLERPNAYKYFPELWGAKAFE